MVMDEDSNKESTPLLSNNNTYYFKNSDRKTEKKIETHPLGATEEDFAPRTLGTVAVSTFLFAEFSLSFSPSCFYSRLTLW